MEDVAELIHGGQIGVIPTDTQYGLVASVFLPEAVERVYHVRERDPEEPFVILIAEIDDLEQFGILVDAELRKKVDAYWPGRVSLVLHCPDEQYSYLHRDKYTLAVRLPKDDDLRELIRQAGPLVAPRANVSDEPPARNIEEAKRYFGTAVDFYVDGGVLDGPPSGLIDLSLGGEPVVLRKGA